MVRSQKVITCESCGRVTWVSYRRILWVGEHLAAKADQRRSGGEFTAVTPLRPGHDPALAAGRGRRARNASIYDDVSIVRPHT